MPQSLTIAPSLFNAISNLPIGQAADNWMTAWLTPIWFLAAGTAIGLIALGGFVVIFNVLSKIPFWESLSRSYVGHAIAAIITLAIAGGVVFILPAGMAGQQELQEPILLGITLVLMCAIIGWSLVFCSGKRAAKGAVATLGEGAASYLGITALVVVFIGLATWGLGLALGRPIVATPTQALASLSQIFTTGERPFTFEIDGVSEGDGPFVKVPLDIDIELLRAVQLESSTTVVLADAENSADFKRIPIRLGASETLGWNDRQPKEELFIPYKEGLSLHVQNQEIDPAILTFSFITRPPVPEATSLVITAVAVLLVGLTILLQQAVAPRASAVAHATVKNELAQPLFLVLMLLGTVAILLYEFLSFNTFGEDIKLLKDCGITTIMLLAAFQGIWSASSSISEEIDGKTALTVLSKPIQRRSFIIGKFLGIFWVLALMFVILGALELGAVAYKPLYDAKEASLEAPTWQLCHLEMMRTVPGLVMAFMQSVVLMAVSVALATRLPQLANLSICFAVYVIGNLTTSLISSTQEGFEIVKFIAQLVATIIPILEHFSMQAAIDAGNPITMSLLSGNLIYCLLYVLLAMFLALLLFEDRDLA